MKKATVALIGRPNVGKSTIFNRIAKRKIAIIEDTPGVTRDRIYAKAEFNDYKFHLIDTGGIDLENANFNTEIKAQAEIAVEEADVILFVVDGKEGITSNDHFIKEMLLKSQKRVIVVINKIDSKLAQDNMYDFYELGFEEYHMVSGEQNEGVYDLLEDVVKDFDKLQEEEYDETKIKFSLIGRPNVGKSSLVNALVNEERVIVSDVAGTTRDAIDTIFKYNGEEYVVIDTAGMRKKGKIYESIEKYSFLRSMKAIDRSDVCVIVINAEEGIIEHDKHIAGYAIEEGKAVVIAVNKWDTMEETTIKEFTDLIRAEFKFLSYAPIVFLSALTKKRIHTLMPEILKVYQNANKEIKTSILNGVVMDAYMLNLPPSYRSKRLKIYFTTQVSTKPPTFNISVNSKGLVHFSYERYLENKIREAFDFEGTPIVLQFKNKGEQYK